MARRNSIRWSPPVELSAEEMLICKRLKRVGRIHVFLRQFRHELLDEQLQAELAALYEDSSVGQPPTPPAVLVLVTLLQAVEGLSDAAAVEAAVFDRRWQMVLDCAGCEEPPFSQGALVDFRWRLMKKKLHHRLVEKSVELAKKTGGFGFKALRVALDSAPLWGAGRVEDTFNLIGHALEVVLTCASVVASVPAEVIRAQAELELLGGKSLKSRLDIDWDDPDEQHRALQRLLAEVQRLKQWLGAHLAAEVTKEPLKGAVEQLEKLVAQDLEPDPEKGGSRIVRGVAKDRQISISDPEMRHGRKSRSRVIEGYKRFIARELDHGLIVGVTVQPANQPEREATETLREQASKYGPVTDLHVDRGFLASEWVGELYDSGGMVSSRAWRPRNQGRYTKSDFKIDLDAKTVHCPAGNTAPIKGNLAIFPGEACNRCALRAACTRAKEGQGRTLTLHKHEGLLMELRQRQATPEGRALLRERVSVEHGLAHVCNRQGRNARYVGTDKNIFDLCRYAVIENLYVSERIVRDAA